MITLAIRTEFAAFARALDDIARRQAPYAAARALTDTAREVRARLADELPRIFDRPTPFTRNALAIAAARREALVATIFVKDIQARYLLLQETGGTRTPSKGRALVVPAISTPLNAYGNIPSGLLKRLRAQAGRGKNRRGRRIIYLPENSRARGGYFEQIGRGRLRRLTGFTAAERFTPRFGFRRRVHAHAIAILPGRLAARLAEALATAR